MATPSDAESATSENPSDLSTADVKKKGKTTTQQIIHPAQYRAVRFVSFMLEESKHEISPADFLRDAVARHLALYQAKRGIEFPAKMLAELTKQSFLTTKSGSEE